MTMNGLQRGLRVDDHDVYWLIAQLHLQTGSQSQASLARIRQGTGQFDEQVDIAAALQVVDAKSKQVDPGILAEHLPGRVADDLSGFRGYSHRVAGL